MTRAGQADDAETRILLETRILHKKDLKTQWLVSPENREFLHLVFSVPNKVVSNCSWKD